jgi:hypothetical protein
MMPKRHSTASNAASSKDSDSARDSLQCMFVRPADTAACAACATISGTMSAHQTVAPRPKPAATSSATSPVPPATSMRLYPEAGAVCGTAASRHIAIVRGRYIFNRAS